MCVFDLLYILIFIFVKYVDSESANILRCYFVSKNCFSIAYACQAFDVTVCHNSAEALVY